MINVDNAQAIARLEQQAADYKEQATTLETMLKHSNRQLEQVRAPGMQCSAACSGAAD
eukprot:SAG11_NODE_5906_length_1437_cov_1.109865_2_plen_58_part_00